jgi:spore maturation protein CgeB
MQLRIVVIDTFYLDFINSLRTISYAKPISYHHELMDVLSHEFGTGMAYARNLRKEGWEVVDIVANHHGLQHKWAHEFGASGTLEQILLAQIEYYKPDVLFFQDLSFLSAATLHQLRQKYLLAGQCSCPMPPRENVAAFHILFTSFPHYVDQFKSLGVHAEYLPLAFDSQILDIVHKVENERDIDIAFVGGIGRDLHWQAGTELMEKVATEFGPDHFVWYGYGFERISPTSALGQCYHGQAWGLDMYRIYLRSKIVVNRHGEVAQNYANNMRMFEATGCGALLVTEQSQNIWDLFSARECATYLTHNECIQQLHYYLDNPEKRREIAFQGQMKTLSDHTYASRIHTISEVLVREVLCQQN